MLTLRVYIHIANCVNDACHDIVDGAVKTFKLEESLMPVILHSSYAAGKFQAILLYLLILRKKASLIFSFFGRVGEWNSSSKIQIKFCIALCER